MHATTAATMAAYCLPRSKRGEFLDVWKSTVKDNLYGSANFAEAGCGDSNVRDRFKTNNIHGEAPAFVMGIVQCRIDWGAMAMNIGSDVSDTSRTKAMLPASKRVILGSIAGALSVLVFHQTILQIFYWGGLAPQAAFRIAVVAPFNAPMVVSITFWGAIYGGLFGWLQPRLPRLMLLRALLAGIFALLMGWFVVRPVAGHPVAFGWQAAPMLRSAAAAMMWGLGTTLIMPLLRPRRLTGTRRWDRRHVAT